MKVIDVSDFDTQNVTDMAQVFEGCYALEEIIGLDKWDTSNVTTMYQMFASPAGYSVSNHLKVLDLSSWDTSNLCDASSMFAYYETLYLSQLEEVIGIEDFGQPNLQNISGIFYENQYFDGDLSAWDTSGLQDLSYAFYGCWRMDIDKLKHWNVSSVSDMTLAFGDVAGTSIQ